MNRRVFAAILCGVVALLGIIVLAVTDIRERDRVEVALSERIRRGEVMQGCTEAEKTERWKVYVEAKKYMDERATLAEKMLEPCRTAK